MSSVPLTESRGQTKSSPSEASPSVGADANEKTAPAGIGLWCVVILLSAFLFFLSLVIATLATNSEGHRLFSGNPGWPGNVFRTQSEPGTPTNALAIAVCVAFGINWLAWIPASIWQTEKFYDLVGSLSFLSLVVVGVTFAAVPSSEFVQTVWRYLPAAMTTIWTIRLGSFLVERVHRNPKGDQRFDHLKTHPARFLVPWTLQGLWAFLTILPALVQLTTQFQPNDNGGPDAASAVGTFLWVLGFACEVVSDHQKKVFAADPANKGRFITTGLWSVSRHPNYFGEMTLWLGVFVMGIRFYSNSQWITAISPLFVVCLISFVSGIPQLEAVAEKRWGSEPAYQAYKRQTPVLIPNPFVSSCQS